MMRRIAIGIALLGVFAGSCTWLALALTEPAPPPPGSPSAERLAPGPFETAEREYVFVDRSRPTAANRDWPGDSERSLDATLWYPADDTGPHPLVIYSHGFMSTREEGSDLAERLASHGYLVLAADYPLTNFGAPGGPNVADFASQPADVSFLIDSALALEGDDKPFAGDVDPERIAVVGLSLGGLTTTLVAFHPEMRDPRVRAAVSIAGPSSFFDDRFYATADLPFLMIAGTGDAMVAYASHARPVLERDPNASLVTIEGGSHTGFASIADPLFRFVDNPDSVGCGALLENLDLDPGANPFAGLGGPEQGIRVDAEAVMPCQGDLAKALHPGRQLMITSLAVMAFLDSVFGSDAPARDAAASYLADELPRDFAEARYERAAHAPRGPRGSDEMAD